MYKYVGWRPSGRESDTSLEEIEEDYERPEDDKGSRNEFSTDSEGSRTDDEFYKFSMKKAEKYLTQPFPAVKIGLLRRILPCPHFWTLYKCHRSHLITLMDEAMHRVLDWHNRVIKGYNGEPYFDQDKYLETDFQILMRNTGVALIFLHSILWYDEEDRHFRIVTDTGRPVHEDVSIRTLEMEFDFPFVDLHCILEKMDRSWFRKNKIFLSLMAMWLFFDTDDSELRNPTVYKTIAKDCRRKLRRMLFMKYGTVEKYRQMKNVYIHNLRKLGEDAIPIMDARVKTKHIFLGPFYGPTR